MQDNLQDHLDKKLNRNGDVLFGELNMSNKRITGLSDPRTDSDACNKRYVDRQDGLRVMKAGDEMDGKLDMNFNTISNVNFPDNNFDAINKMYL